VDLAAADVSYLTGFYFAQTERPAAVAVPRDGEPILLLPLLDVDQAAEECWIDDVRTYREYPGTTHPIVWMAGEVAAAGFGRSRIGIDLASLSVTNHHRLTAALPQASFVDVGGLVSAMRRVKEPAEIDAVRAAARYADRTQEVGLRLLRERAVRTEYELLVAITAAVQSEIVRERKEIHGVRSLVSGAVVSGPKTAYPHGFTGQRTLRPGEAVMLSFGCAIDGYRAENTRTYWLGDLTPEARALDDAVARTQAAARGLVTPGTRCSEIDAWTLRSLEGAGFGGLVRHRVGHGIGLEGHEPPWLEAGDETVLEPNMVVSIEPGLYRAGFAGFLIADTILVTADGAEALSASPRAAAESPIAW
jgi:Xaa-Pro dipeptidase